jgi:hypothetical protein
VTDPLHLDDDTIEIRRLVELGLARSKSAGPPSAKTAERAKQLAAKTIDHLLDSDAPTRKWPAESAGCSKGRRNFEKCASIRKSDPPLVHRLRQNSAHGCDASALSNLRPRRAQDSNCSNHQQPEWKYPDARHRL